MKHIYKWRSTGKGGRTDFHVFRDGKWVAGEMIRESGGKTHGDAKLEASEGEVVFEEEISNTGIHRCQFLIVENDKLTEFDPQGTPFEDAELPCELPWDEHIWDR